jgi:hypothetical protein
VKITVWLATRDRSTWIALTEGMVLAWIVLEGPGRFIRMLVGLPVLVHLAYTAMTGLPIGTLPGRPAGAKRDRVNQDLRSHVIGFLNEVRRVEEYAQRARTAGLPSNEVQDNLAAAQRRMMAAAAQVVKVTGRSVEDVRAEQRPAEPLLGEGGGLLRNALARGRAIARA